MRTIMKSIQPGGKAGMWLNPDRPGGEQLNSKVIGQVLKKGDVLRLVGAGGGGWGKSEERDAALVERDRAEGFCNRRMLRRDD